MPRPLEAIIWDVDGTLAETEELHRAAFNHAFAESGLDWWWSEGVYRELLKTTGGKERIATFQSLYQPGGLGSERIAGLHLRKTAIYKALVREGAAKPRPGVLRLLAQARLFGMKLAVASTTSAGNLETLLAASFGEDRPRFDAVICGDAVRAKKPSPDVYLAALEALGLSAASCIAVEDSGVGLAAARAAGVDCVVVPSRWTVGDDFSGALAVVDSLGDPDRPAVSLGGPPPSGPVVDLAQLAAWRSNRL